MLLLHFLLNHSHVIKDVTVVSNGRALFLIIILQLLSIKESFFITSSTLIIFTNNRHFPSYVAYYLTRDTRRHCLLQSAIQADGQGKEYVTRTSIGPFAAARSSFRGWSRCRVGAKAGHTTHTSPASSLLPHYPCLSQWVTIRTSAVTRTPPPTSLLFSHLY